MWLKVKKQSILIFISIAIFAFVIFIPAGRTENASVCADTLLCEYQSVQDAIDGIGKNGFISIHGTYEEDITIHSDQDLILIGDPFNISNSVIKGKVTLKPGAKLEFDYMTLNAKGKKYAIKAGKRAKLLLKYGVVKNAKIGIWAKKKAKLDIYEQRIIDNKRFGIKAEARNSVIIAGYSKIYRNNKAGIKAFNPKIIEIQENRFRKNGRAINLLNVNISDRKTYDYIMGNKFTKNKIAIRLYDAKVYLTENRYYQNDINILRLP